MRLTRLFYGYIVPGARPAKTSRGFWTEDGVPILNVTHISSNLESAEPYEDGELAFPARFIGFVRKGQPAQPEPFVAEQNE